MGQRMESPAASLIAAIENDKHDVPEDAWLDSEHVEKLASAVDEIVRNRAASLGEEAAESEKVASAVIEDAAQAALQESIREDGGFATPADALNALLDQKPTKEASGPSLEETLIADAVAAAVNEKIASDDLAGDIDEVLGGHADTAAEPEGSETGVENLDELLVAGAVRSAVEAGNAR